MRSTKWLAFTLMFFSPASYSYADEIKDLVMQQISAKTFMGDLYIEEYQALNIVDGEYTVSSKEEIKELFEIVGEQILDTEITSLRLMSRADTEDFTTVTFEYEWALKMGNTQMDGKVSGVGVFMKVDEGYVSIFDAQTM